MFQAVYAPMVMCVFSGITWMDTTVCQKCMNLALPIIRQLHTDQRLKPDDATHLYSLVCKKSRFQVYHTV